MYLKKLKIQGFKSFADQTILLFPKPKEDRFNIIGVVGPNGSGKSNVLDAIQWGLGEQSMKSLRSKKLEDIIFSGSQNRGSKNKAEVKLFFDNQKGKSPIDYKEFTITRTIYKDGTSEYKLNNNEVRLKDILLLLAKTNFGQKSYSIVNQGMVDKVLISSPKERKEFFDEATGIQKYIYKKEHALNKIEKSQENLKEAKIALREITPRMNSLTRQVKKLSHKKEVKEELQKLQTQYYGEKIKSINQNINKQEKQRKELEQKLANVKQKLDTFQNQSKKIVYKKQENKYKNLQEKQQETLDKKSELISQRSETRAKIEILESQLEKEQEKNINQPQQKNIQITDSNKIFKNINEIKGLQEKQLQSINESHSLNDLKKIKSLSQKILNKVNSLFNFFKKNPIKKEEKKDFYNEKSIINDLKTKLEKTNDKINTVDKDLQKIKDNISNFNDKEQEKREKLLEWQQATQKKQSKLNNVNNQLNQIDIKITRLETRKEDLESEIKNEMGISLKELLQNDINNEGINYNQISKLKNKLNIIGGIDPAVEKEYPKVKERYDFLKTQTQDLSKTITSLLKIVKELNRKIESTFKTKFVQIEKEFNYYFQTIFGGGKAKLAFQERENKEEKNNSSLIKGIEIFACPPDKKIKNIEMLSGGEKALTALALICAIIAINKPPFVILDEADAALDQKNSTRFANILKKLRKHTQFIIITHNQQTIQITDILYGTTMTKAGASKLVSLKLEEEN